MENKAVKNKIQVKVQATIIEGINTLVAEEDGLGFKKGDHVGIIKNKHEAKLEEWDRDQGRLLGYFWSPPKSKETARGKEKYEEAMQTVLVDNMTRIRKPLGQILNGRTVTSKELSLYGNAVPSNPCFILASSISIFFKKYLNLPVPPISKIVLGVYFTIWDTNFS